MTEKNKARGVCFGLPFSRYTKQDKIVRVVQYYGLVPLDFDDFLWYNAYKSFIVFKFEKGDFYGL